MDKIKALEAFTGEEATASNYDDCVFDSSPGEYLVLTDEEADERVREYIGESLWAFNANFLTSMTGLPSEIFEALQDRCEDANDTFSELIERTCGMDEFCDAAISADGRGHFLSGYDGEEIESGDFFIYRTN